MAASLISIKKVAPKSIDTVAIAEVIDRIETLSQGIAKFWSKGDGWAPVTAAGLLGKLRLRCARPGESAFCNSERRPGRRVHFDEAAGGHSLSAGPVR